MQISDTRLKIFNLAMMAGVVFHFITFQWEYPYSEKTYSGFQYNPGWHLYVSNDLQIVLALVLLFQIYLAFKKLDRRRIIIVSLLFLTHCLIWPAFFFNYLTFIFACCALQSIIYLVGNRGMN